MKNRLSLITVLGMSLGVAACNSDYGSIDKTPFPTDEPIAGIWTGPFTYTPPDGSAAHTVNVTLVADESNEMWMLEQDVTASPNCYHLDYGSAFSKQSNITGNYGFGTNCPFTDGANKGSGTITGTVDYHVTLDLTFTETDSKNFLYATFAPTFMFNDQYLSPSALATLAGTYTDSAGGTVTVDAGGNITGATAGTTCSVTGTISILNANYDVYRVTYAFANCGTANSNLNGVTLTGMGFYQPAGASVTTNQFIFMTHGTDNTGANIVAYDAFAS